MGSRTDPNPVEGSGGKKDCHQNTAPDRSVGKVGAAKVPDLNRKSIEGAERELAKQGFKFRSETKGGYRRYDSPDGSTIWIRPNGEVVRLGSKIGQGPNQKGYYPRYDRYGNRTPHDNDVTSKSEEGPRQESNRCTT